MSVWIKGTITTYEEFSSAFVTPEQRREFLMACAKAGFKAIRKAWPDQNVRLFVFGSAANHSSRVGATSDLDIAISGADQIGESKSSRLTQLSRVFRKGLGVERHALPIDFLFFNAEDPQTWFAKEIVEHGIEIKLEHEKPLNAVLKPTTAS